MTDTVKTKPETNPTAATYNALSAAFAHFNASLFDDDLPPVMLVLHRKRHAHGYFWNGMWRHRDDKDRTMSEIALNPQTMGRTITEVLSTLVHEMVHHEQHVFGKPGKSVAHNKEWAEMMDRVGLTPTSTGQPGGKRTGRNVTHMIVDGGPFDVACKALLQRNDVDMSWFSPARATIKKADRSKVKHTCPECGTNAWCKENTNLVCGDCERTMEEA